MAVLKAKYRGSERADTSYLLAKGILPMEVHTKANRSTQIVASFEDVRDIIKESGGIGIFDIQVGSSTSPKTVIVNEINRNGHDNRIHHLTLKEVSDSDLIKINIPVKAEGVPASAKKGKAVLAQPRKRIKVKGKVADVQGILNVDVSWMKPGDVLRAGDISLPQGVELQTPESEVVLRLERA